MNNEMVKSILKGALYKLAGVLVTAGYLKSSDTELLVGGATTILAVICSVWQHWGKRNPSDPTRPIGVPPVTPTKVGILVGGLSIALLLVGCAGVPVTRFKFGNMTFECPKDVSGTNLVATISTNGTLTLSIGSWRSVQDVAVFKAAMDANVKQAQSAVDGLKTLGQAAMTTMK